MDERKTLSKAEQSQLSTIVAERYGHEFVSFAPLGGELDLNFRATTASGSHIFLRLTPASFDQGAVEWQNAVLQQLARTPLSVAAPRLLPSLEEAPCVPVTLTEDEPWLLRLTTWIDGTSVSELGETDRAFRLQLGSLAAEVVNRLAPLNACGSGHHEHHWMAERAGDSLRDTMDAARDPRQRAMLETSFEWFTEVEAQLDGLPRTVVHQDLHDFNLLGERDASGFARIVGVVDFNDAVHTVRVAELAVAAVYAALRQEDAFEAFSDVVDGYLSVAELTPSELDVLFPLGVARLAVNASTWTQRALGDNAEYANARMAATWPALEQLLQVPRETARDRWERSRTRLPSAAEAAETAETAETAEATRA